MEEETQPITEIEVDVTDIHRYPAFMLMLYEKKLRASENLTMTPGLEKDREEWSVKADIARDYIAQGGNNQ